MNAIVIPFPAAVRPYLNAFGETPEEEKRRRCLAALEDSFGREFADTMGAMIEAETAEVAINHAEALDRLNREFR